MNEYIRGTQDFSARFRDAENTFNQHIHTATDEEIAQYEDLKGSYSAVFNENTETMFQLPRNTDLATREGLTLLIGTKDNCLNKLAEVVYDMENLADEVSGGVGAQDWDKNRTENEATLRNKIWKTLSSTWNYVLFLVLTLELKSWTVTLIQSSRSFSSMIEHLFVPFFVGFSEQYFLQL